MSIEVQLLISAPIQIKGENMFQSNALWPKGVCSSKYGDNISTDKHTTKEQAQGVCKQLCLKGFGGDGNHFPLATWVSEVQDPPILPFSSKFFV